MPTFTAFLDYISVTDEVRNLAYNTLQAEFDDNMIVSYQVKEYSNLKTWTHKNDWTTASDTFYAIQLQETRLAAADIIEHYGTGTQQQIAACKSLREAVRWDLYGSTNGVGADGGIIGNLPDEDISDTIDDSIDVVSSLYGSYPASLQDDVNAIPFRSTDVFI